MENQSHKELFSWFHWDALAIIITLVYNAIIITCGIYAFRDSVLIAAILMICVFVLPILFMPLSLRVSENDVKIFRLIGRVRISLCDVKSVTIIEDDERFFNKLIRTCGSGGAYGYWGFFKHEKHGKVRMFVTDREQCFLIKCNDGKVFVVSSPKRQEIVGYLNSNLN